MTATEKQPRILTVLQKAHANLLELAGYPFLFAGITVALLTTVLVASPSTWIVAAVIVVLLIAEMTTRDSLPTPTRLTAPHDGRAYLGSGHALRVLLLITATASVLTANGGIRTQHIIIVLFVAGLLLVEPLTVRMGRRGAPQGAHLPWAAENPQSLPPQYPAYVANNIALLVVCFFPSDLAVVITLLCTAMSVVAQVATWLVASRRTNIKKHVDATLTRELAKYSPQFYVYYDAPVGTAYQLAMWLPYLDQLGERYAVILRNQATLDEVAPLTQAPIIVRKDMASLDSVIVDSVKAVFYVNNAIKNAHFVRFHQYTHIQLNHGDSDKPPSYNPAMRMYDRNFVAGQAAVERYAARGVETHPHYFEIVGRPQITGIQLTEAETVPASPTVLYAPTWAGFMADSQCSSLPIGLDIINAYVDAGARIIFRPHPHARNTPRLRAACDAITERLTALNDTTGTGHVIGEQAEREWSIIDCFNQSDILVSDVSSVVPDYLYSAKPIVLTEIGVTHREEFLTDNPIGVGCYILREDLSNLDKVVTESTTTDPLKSTRLALRSHYLGDFPAETYEEAFLTTAARYVRGE